MASGLVKRVVDRGDIFLVIESTVYVANVSWSGIWQEVGTVSALRWGGEAPLWGALVDPRMPCPLLVIFVLYLR